METNPNFHIIINNLNIKKQKTLPITNWIAEVMPAYANPIQILSVSFGLNSLFTCDYSIQINYFCG